jgi:hypothetical protein
MATYEEDKAWGKEQEKLMFRPLRKFFGKTLVHNDDEYAPWDFEDSQTAIEMKSRKLMSYDFDEVMIKTLKIERCGAESRDCFLVFKFLDRLCYIEYNKEQFSRYRKRLMTIKSRADKVEKPEWRTFIPLAHMKTLATFPIQCLISDDI